MGPQDAVCVILGKTQFFILIDYHLGVSFEVEDCFDEAAEPGRAIILPNSNPVPPHDRFRECFANCALVN